jgi:hypothetical protein
MDTNKIKSKIKGKCKSIIEWYESGRCNNLNPRFVYIILKKINNQENLTYKQVKAITNIYNSLNQYIEYL